MATATETLGCKGYSIKNGFERYYVGVSCQGEPSPGPTLAPTGPSKEPSIRPSRRPSWSRTRRPTAGLTAKPTPAPTAEPTSSPTTIPSGVPSPPPTVEPSLIQTTPPSIIPTPTPTGQGTQLCSPFSATDTYSASQNYGTCLIYACGGSSITASACTGTGVACAGDTYLRLFSQYPVAGDDDYYSQEGYQVAQNDDYCELCSQLTYMVPFGTACQTYTLQEGCFLSRSCSATVNVLVVSVGPSAEPSPRPTAVPTPQTPGNNSRWMLMPLLQCLGRLLLAAKMSTL